MTRSRGLRRNGSILPRSRLALRDLAAEAVAGMVQRPTRTGLTALGTVLGVGAFVTVLGLTATTSAQIDDRFTALAATEVIVEQAGTSSDPNVGSGLGDPNVFPDDSDARVGRIMGVRHAGVWWAVPDLAVSTVSLPSEPVGESPEVRAASPGLLDALRPTVGRGRLYDEFHNERAERVAVLGAAAAAQLGITNLAVQPAILIDSIPFTVVGVIADVERSADALSTVLLPRRTAEMLWGDRPEMPPTMIIDTDLGAARVVAEQAAVALRPDAPELFQVVPPPDPRALREGVATDLAVLFLMLAGVSLVIGAVGIANTTMVAVLERVNEVGLRRALGARRYHVATQFLAESAATGSIGGLVGTTLGIVSVVIVSIIRQWTPLVEPWTVALAPLTGSLVGILAGVYPALRAARIEPVEALRR